MDEHELEALLADLESDRVERKASASDMDKLRQVICAFANDLPGHGKPGVLFIGVDDHGQPVGMKVTDELLRNLGGIRAEGKILPLPMLSVEKRVLRSAECAVVTVAPSYSTPVRFDGRVWIRVGPRRAVASADEERRLTEKRQAADLPYDEQPVRGALVSDLNVSYFTSAYLPKVVAPEVVAENRRTTEEQLASVRFLATDLSTPTVAGILVLGLDPLRWLPGAYVEVMRFDGTDVSAPIRNRKKFDGLLENMLRNLEQFLPWAIETALAPVSAMQVKEMPDYPVEALRELVFNAVMHRSYQGTNAQVRIFWFNDRIEIDNPGGLYGHVTPDNLGQTTAYRNPVLAEAMHALKYVERFGIGITRVRTVLARNGNPPPEFVCRPESVRVIVRKKTA